MVAFFTDRHTVVVMLALAASLFILSKSASLLVDKAVLLSEKWGLSAVVIGATVVSLGTTLPELSVSVIAAVQGNVGFALGNAVGSIITNSTLILGMAALFGYIAVGRREGQKLKLLIAAALGMMAMPLMRLAIGGGAVIPRFGGILLAALVPVYVIFLVVQEKRNPQPEEATSQAAPSLRASAAVLVGQIVLAALAVALSAAVLVAAAEVLARRIGIPDAVIASTLVAFGTSVPELSTAIAAARGGHGALALGNVLGASILNILLVVGLAVSLSPAVAFVNDEALKVHFPALIITLGVLGFFAYNQRIHTLSKKEGMLLIGIYILFLFVNFFLSPAV